MGVSVTARGRAQGHVEAHERRLRGSTKPRPEGRNPRRGKGQERYGLRPTGNTARSERTFRMHQSLKPTWVSCTSFGFVRTSLDQPVRSTRFRVVPDDLGCGERFGNGDVPRGFVQRHEGQARREAWRLSEGGILWRQKLKGVTGVKQSRKVRDGVTRQEVEKTWRRCTAGRGKPGVGRCRWSASVVEPQNPMGGPFADTRESRRSGNHTAVPVRTLCRQSQARVIGRILWTRDEGHERREQVWKYLLHTHVFEHHVEQAEPAASPRDRRTEAHGGSTNQYGARGVGGTLESSPTR
jgi:hypothetical protein